MAATTIIDRLIVQLGLDPREFSKGQKQAAAEQTKLQEHVRKSSESMSRSFLGFTAKVAGLTTAAIAVKKFIQYTSELSTGIRQLGIDSDNFHIAANELRNFGNVAETMGGKAEDVTRTVGSLSKAVYDLAYNGQISDSLIMLGRLGVQFQDTAGNMRDFKSIAFDAQSAIQKQMAGGMTRSNAFQMLQQAGFDTGLSNAMLEGTLKQQLDRQGQRRQITSGDVKLATDWEKSAANRSQAIDAAAVRQLGVEAIPGTAANNALAEGFDKAGTLGAGEAVSKFGDVVSDAGHAVKEGVTNFLLGLEKLADNLTAKNMPKGRAAYEADIQGAAKKYDILPEMLAGLLSTESNFNPTAVNEKSGATGIAQLQPKFFPGAGKNPHADIYTSAQYLRKLHDSHMKAGEADDDGAWSLALQSYNAGQSRVRRSMAGGKPLAQETIDYPGKVLGYASGAMVSPDAQRGAVQGGARTDITFENVTINTPRTDGEGVATEFTAATRRKMNAAQADAGVQ